MPRYNSRSRSRKARERKRVSAQVPKDKRKLAHWAVRGTHKDYEKLRQHARDLAPERPSYVTDQGLDVLQNANRRALIESSAQHDNHWFLDSLAWLLDKAPGPKWLKGLGQAALKPFRGDHINETDELYARLVSQGYNEIEARPDEYQNWTRQPEFDSNYVSVFDNEDGHRFISVRGTKAKWQDLKEDAFIGVRGRPHDLVGKELQRILDHTEPGRIVDIGGHSLGTSLILTAFSNDSTMQDRVHETYLFNPAMSPLAHNVTQDFEKDPRVRYFIDVSDPVSVGGLGEMGPKNVVYRSHHKNPLNPLNSHSLAQWGGAESANLSAHDEIESPPPPKEEPVLPYDSTGDGLPDSVEPAPEHESVGEEFNLDFGQDFDSSAWNVYWGDEKPG